MKVLCLNIGGRIYEAHPVLIPGETIVPGATMLERAKAVVGDWGTKDDFNWIREHAQDADALQNYQLLFLAWVHPGPYSVTSGIFNRAIGQWTIHWSSSNAHYVFADRILVRRPAIEHDCEWVRDGDCDAADTVVNADTVAIIQHDADFCQVGQPADD